jgi:hypothetical protein
MLSNSHTIRRGNMLEAASRAEEKLAPLRKTPQCGAEPKAPALPSPPPVQQARAPEMPPAPEAPPAPRPRVRYNPRDHAEVFAAIADVTGVWIHCEHRACLRAKRCTAPEPPCFVTHIGDFHEYLHTRLGPHFRKRIALQDFPGPEAE